MLCPAEEREETGAWAAEGSPVPPAPEMVTPEAVVSPFQTVGEPAPLNVEVPEEPAVKPPPRLHSQLTETRERALRSGLLGRRPTSEPQVPAAIQDEPAPDPDVPPGFPPGFASPFAIAAPSVPPPFQVPLGSLPVRVRALADWLREQFAPESLFIADDQGQPLLEWRGGGEWLAAASLLAEAAERAQRHLPQEPAGTVLHLPLGSGKSLSLVGGETPLGYWRAGLVSAQPLQDQQARLVARALKKVAEGEPS